MEYTKRIEQLQDDLKIAIKGFEIGKEAQEKKMQEMQIEYEQKISELSQCHSFEISSMRNDHSHEVQSLIA